MNGEILEKETLDNKPLENELLDKELVRPKELVVEKASLTSSYGKMTAEPLERGFGTTLGNALRRVLLSSLPGAAVTSVKIDGILGETSTIPGVKEDVTDIILNLKELRFKLHTEGPKVVQLKAKGPGEARAKDIVTGDDVEIADPDHLIATLSKGGKLSIEMIVQTGRGYVPAERNRKKNQAKGTIAVDAAFSPVRKVNYTVANARVGQRTDYDKLILEVWTDGNIGPVAAVAQAAKILDDQFSLFAPEEKREMREASSYDYQEEDLSETLLQSVDELGLSARAVNSLKAANIRLLGDLAQKTEEEILSLKFFGEKSLDEIKKVLEERGLRPGMKLEDWPPEKREDQKRTVEEFPLHPSF
jgi:DNA-directed RNA polymerase subunit alpha